MVNTNVPVEHPLTNQADATQVFIVRSADDDDMGIYFTQDRAIAYLKDWLAETVTLITRTEEKNSRTKVWVNNGEGHHDYVIETSFLRM